MYEKNEKIGIFKKNTYSDTGHCADINPKLIMRLTYTAVSRNSFIRIWH